MNLVIRRAMPSSLEAINAVIEAAKRSHGYDEAYVAAALPLLRVDEDYLTHCSCFEADLDGCVVGFAAVAWGPESAGEALLDHVWIAPEVHRQGIGRRLLAACVASARARQIAQLMIIADPPSEAFYRRLGATCVSAKPSRIPGGPIFPVLMLRVSVEL